MPNSFHIDKTLTRPHFSPRQLVTAEDLNAGVDYMVERTRRHNRFLHGCGVACGLEMAAALGESSPETGITSLAIAVNAGAAIGPQGDMITVPALPMLEFTDVMLPDGRYQTLNDFLKTIELYNSAPLYLLLRHAPAAPSGHRPAFPGHCPDSEGLLSPTRLQEGYALALATERPPDCPPERPLSCLSLLDPTAAHHHGALMILLGCNRPDSDAAWVVLGTVVITLTIDSQRRNVYTSAVHHRDRSLLPSARALMQLLACFPERLRIDSCEVIAAWPGVFSVYMVRVTGAGLAPLVKVAVEGINDQQVTFQANQQTDRQVLFTVATSLDLTGERAVKIETEFDIINSADCGVLLHFPPGVVIKPSGVIGGGNF